MPLIIIAAAAALAYLVLYAGRPEGQHPIMASVVKTLSTTALAVYGALNGAPGMIVLGLALGAAGDFALSRPGTTAFLAGMAAFAMGHLAYAAQFWTWGTPGIAGWHWAALGALALLVASTEVWLAPHTAALRWPVRAYGGVIGAMAATALLLAPAAGMGLTALGVGLFVASDVLLAVQIFVVKAFDARRILAWLLWPAYWLGQALILAGAAIHG